MEKSVLRHLKNYYSKEMFIPSFMGIFINPFYIIRKGLFKGIIRNKKYVKGRLLDFGCGSKPYKEILHVAEYIGVDIEVSGNPARNHNIDMYYDGKTIPFQDNNFDSIFSSEVFEHVFNLEEILLELYRVLKPDGYMLITLPFAWEEHEIPYDFARYSSFGIKHLLEKSGFDVISIEKTTNYVETVFQMWNAYMSQHVLPSNSFLRAAMIPFIISPMTIIGIALSKILPNNKNYYHNNIVVAHKAK